MALFCTVASAATPSFDKPFHADSLSLMAPHPAHRTAASENATSLVSCQGSNAACSLALKPDGGAIKRHFSPNTTLGHLATEQATTFAKGPHPANEGRALDASKAGLSPADQHAINDTTNPVAKPDGYALMLSVVGMILMLVVRRRRLD